MELCELIHCLLALAAFVLLLLVVIAHVTAGMMDLRCDEKEKYFQTAAGLKEPFPSLSDPPSLALSVVVPSYNEESRLPVMMEEAMEYLENRRVIIVDDGSKDKTTEVGLGYTKKYGDDKVRVLTLVKNRGKGGAVRMGTLRTRGRLILMADADGATKFADFAKVEAGLQKLSPKLENMAISCGSRAHLEKEAVAQRSLFRTFLMYGFHFLVWFFCVKGIKDTQCGFKLFTREAALRTFSSLHVERWAFDVELLYIAQCFQIPIAEVAVNWTEIEGSKLVPFWSWLQMGKDLIFIRLRYITGAWRLEYPRKSQ
ncbi:dolichyl-phosphate beta-glucosyltransferase isoform X2 [Tachysurus fulvidraco]|uniref:dolichyl-phosphate beta-glucosyltransferase isoform X2 n=1 Tax=Tachysurus fulvidraco TaxID=1234273 RepID=UPI001FEF5EA3|nr:dolichyl-phosphate beta-glucosyltransferase isoform X2 [Tachysurus fulvidraco]